MKKDTINNEEFEKYLYTQGLFPDLDFLIRTSGEKRISNFMLYQIAYAELYFQKYIGRPLMKNTLTRQ